MLGKLLVVVGVMFGFGYALVPMYRAICDALGINVLSLSESAPPPPGRQVSAKRRQYAGRHARAPSPSSSTPMRAGPGTSSPPSRSLQVHPGELTTVMYEFSNVQNRTMAAQAIPSYAPRQATPHFNKLECFCFNEYTLAGRAAVAGGVRHRPQAAARRDHHHACPTPSSRSAARCRHAGAAPKGTVTATPPPTGQGAAR
jgi:cytochrome c oxidase assembly protein Cox11